VGPVGPGADTFSRRDRNARRPSRLDRVARRGVCPPTSGRIGHHPTAPRESRTSRQFEDDAAAESHGARRRRNEGDLHHASESAENLRAGVRSHYGVRHRADRRADIRHRSSGWFSVEQSLGLEQQVLASGVGRTAGMAATAALAAVSGASRSASPGCATGSPWRYSS
jgi:hypothetical protein